MSASQRNATVREPLDVDRYSILRNFPITTVCNRAREGTLRAVFDVESRSPGGVQMGAAMGFLCRDNSIAPSRLGAIKGIVGCFQQVFGTIPVVGKHGDTNGERHGSE